MDETKAMLLMLLAGLVFVAVMVGAVAYDKHESRRFAEAVCVGDMSAPERAAACSQAIARIGK